MALRQPALVGWIVAFPILAVAFGCGNRANVDDSLAASCHPGTEICLSKDVGQICNEQGQWATFQCGPDRTCSKGACVPSEPACADGESACLTDNIGQLCNHAGAWVSFVCGLGQTCNNGDCQEACLPDSHECATDWLQRICRSDGSGWQMTECPTGASCENGECVGQCAPGVTSCMDPHRVRRCRENGEGYDDYECPTAMGCANGICASNSSAACTFGQDVCLNDETQLECLRNGTGYLVKDCPSGTRCRSGKCMGSVCSPGETRCSTSATTDFTGVQTCNEDGAGYSISLCPAAGKCLVDPETGRHGCYVPPCTSGAEVCGDPDSETRSTDYLSRCETRADGRLNWVAYQCDSPSVCKSTSATAAACHSDCSPGDTRCDSKGTAVETCSDGGVWVAKTCATTSDPEAVCVLNPSTNKVVCGDKDCRTLQSNVTSYTTRGRCAANQIRMCNEQGRLAAPVACEEGQCINDSDGFGTCKDPTRCSQDDGWRECIASNDAYRTCLSGHWEFTLCDEGEACTNVGDGLATCGNDCIPGKLRCVDANYQICTDDGTWGDSQSCSVGECNALTNRCETACVPGQLQCVGDVLVASDGTSLGSRAVQTCNANGAWDKATNCAQIDGEGRLCRRSGVGEHVGCVTCIGSAVPAGNEEGAVDSRCSPDGTGYQICQADNNWPATRVACTGTEHCAKQRDGSATGTCSNYGCTTGRSKRCVGYETLATAVAIDDCCAGDCDAATGVCLHRKSHYDPTCVETSACFTGRYDADGVAINEDCCLGFCRSGQGCLKIKAQACETVTSCEIVKLDHMNVCCGDCLSTGLCSSGTEATYPFGEYFACGTATNICLGIGACAWKSSGSTSGAMFANCIE